jgi:ribosomal protein S18 acetylase RimI-like enzyme
VTLVAGPGDGATEVTVWTLESRDPADLRPPSRPARVDPVLLRADRPAPSLSRFFYATVGEPWLWVDRRGWAPRRWREWVDRPEHHLTSAWVDGAPAGYVELEQQPDGDVEIAYFGLLPDVAGLGLGGHLLTHAVASAWALPGTRRVWVHTCSLDAPAALDNYRARGLRVVATHTEYRLLPPGWVPGLAWGGLAPPD